MEREAYMSLALELAREAAAEGEVPVGCVIAGPDGAVIGRGRNRREETGDATAHAELEAIRQACAALGDWRYGHRPAVYPGVLREDCAALLRDFFRDKR